MRPYYVLKMLIWNSKIVIAFNFMMILKNLRNNQYNIKTSNCQHGRYEDGVSSEKSGGKIENNVLFRYFIRRCKILHFLRFLVGDFQALQNSLVNV